MTATEPPLYQAELFGGLTLRVVGGGRNLTRFRSRRTAALLAYLAYHPGRRHPRETLVERFWPDAPTAERARASLAVALSSLRAQLEPPGMTMRSKSPASTAVAAISLRWG